MIKTHEKISNKIVEHTRIVSLLSKVWNKLSSLFFKDKGDEPEPNIQAIECEVAEEKDKEEFFDAEKESFTDPDNHPIKSILKN